MKWKSQGAAYESALDYMTRRAKGDILSLKTPWQAMNKVGIDGFEFPSTIVIAGRPGSGKSLVEQIIVKHAFTSNKLPELRSLRFQYEMVGRVSAIREFSSAIQKSYSYICSAEDNVISQQEYEACVKYAQSMNKLPIDIVDEPLTVPQMAAEIKEYFKTYNCKHLLVTIDHSLLVKKLPGQDIQEMIFDLGSMMTTLKKQYPVIFVVLSQLNRGVDTIERSKEGTAGNYLLDSDIFGSDFLLQFTDVLVGINRPGLKNIRIYGPEKYQIVDKNIIVMHYLKVRNGEPAMSFYRGEFDKMNIVSIPPPNTQSISFKP
jgi:replicative DNA helicase